MPPRDALDPVDGVVGDRYEIGGILCYPTFKSGGEIKENRQHL